MKHHQDKPTLTSSALPLSSSADDFAVRSDVRNKGDAARTTHPQEDRFQALTSALKQLTWIATADGHLCYFPGWPALTGQPVTNVGPAEWREAVHPDDRERAGKEWAETIATRRLLEMECRIRCADGAYRWFHMRGVPILEEDGTVREWVGFIRDITERKQLTILQIVSDAALAHLDLEQLLPEILKRLRAALGVDNIAILLRESEQWLTVRAASGVEEEALGARIPFGRGLAGHIAASRQPLVVEDLAQHDVVTPVLKQKLKSFLGVPLLIDDRVIGVLHIGAAHAHQFSSDDVRLLQLIGDRIALSLDRANLYAAEAKARQAAEEALARAERNEKHLRRLVDANIVGILSGEGENVREANGAFLEMVGFTQEELEAGALNWRVMTPSELAQVDDQKVAEVLTLGACTPYEKEFHRKDGSRVPVLIGIVMIEREPFTWVGVVLDLSERKRLEREAAERAAELEGIFAALTAAVVVINAEGRITRLNPAAQTLYDLAGGPGYQVRPMVERTAKIDVRDASGALLAPERWPGERLLRGEIVVGEDLQFTTRHGVTLTLNFSGVPLRDARGAITGGIAVYQDITERRALERRTHASLDALLRMAQTVVGTDGDFPMMARDLAEVTCKVLGCRRVSIQSVEAETQIVRSLAVVGLTPEEEKQWWAMQRADARFGEGGDPDQVARFAEGEIMVLDMTEPPFDQLPNPFEITTALFAPMRVDGRLVGILSLDHSGERHAFTDQEIALAGGVSDLAALLIERERLQAAHTASQAKALALAETNARMHTFLGIAGHELRTPVTSIKTSVQLSTRVVRQVLEAGIPEAVRPRLARAAGLLDGANNQVDKLNRFITDLLDVTRIQAGKIDMDLAQIDLTTVVREATNALGLIWPERDLTLAVPESPMPVWGDADRLWQVVTNLVTNALKYSPEDQPVRVQLRAIDGEAWMEVIDNGPGLSEEQQKLLFQAFGRVDGIQPQSGMGVGLGLGLYICKTIVERHGGHMGVESQPGQGATFWLAMPLMKNDDLSPQESYG